MVIEGEVKYGREIGKPFVSEKYTYMVCPDCGKGRWLTSSHIRYVNFTKRCRRCSLLHNRVVSYGSQNAAYKNGRTMKQGYVMLTISPDDFFHSMADSHHRIPEHRLIMAKTLGRNLHSWEIVHHKNHIRNDNHIENLQLVSDDRHKQITILERKIARLEAENKKLKSLLNLPSSLHESS